jgi:hypothetical protein
MRRISSRMTFVNKRVFPVVYFGLLLAFMAVPLALSIVRNTASPPLAAFIVPAILIVGGYFLMRRLIFILVDEVWDNGNVLVIKNRGEQERIALSDIKTVSYSPFANPPRVTLSFLRSTAFGDEIIFNGPMRLMAFGGNPVLQDLIDRVDRARRKD